MHAALCLSHRARVVPNIAAAQLSAGPTQRGHQEAGAGSRSAPILHAFMPSAEPLADQLEGWTGDPKPRPMRPKSRATELVSSSAPERLMLRLCMDVKCPDPAAWVTSLLAWLRLMDAWGVLLVGRSAGACRKAMRMRSSPI